MVVRATPTFSALVRHRAGRGGARQNLPPPLPSWGSLSPQRSLAGRPPDVQSRSRWMSVAACSFVTFLLLDVLLCIWMLHRFLGQVTRPIVHQDTLALEQVRAGAGRLHPVPDHMRQGRLDHFPGMVRFLTRPVPEAGAETVRHRRNPKLAHHPPQLMGVERLPAPMGEHQGTVAFPECLGRFENLQGASAQRHPVLGPQRDLVRHMQALPHREVAAAIETVRASSARPVVKLAFEFLVLTAARSGEVRGAVWSEMDRDGSVWTVPAARMKTHREHRVPLCRRALEILEEARALGGGGRFVFPSVQPGKQLGDMMLSGLLKDLKIAAVPHGFRSSFRDWAAEETNHPREVIEAALAHVVRNPVEAAYARSDLFERRRRLMDDWAGYLAGGSRGAGRPVDRP